MEGGEGVEVDRREGGCERDDCDENHEIVEMVGEPEPGIPSLALHVTYTEEQLHVGLVV